MQQTGRKVIGWNQITMTMALKSVNFPMGKEGLFTMSLSGLQQPKVVKRK